MHMLPNDILSNVFLKKRKGIKNASNKFWEKKYPDILHLNKVISSENHYINESI